jgi:hypothetical protein
MCRYPCLSSWKALQFTLQSLYNRLDFYQRQCYELGFYRMGAKLRDGDLLII